MSFHYLTVFDLLLSIAFTAIEIITLSLWIYLIFSSADSLTSTGLALAAFKPGPLLSLLLLYVEHTISRIARPEKN
jgi:hypothetical protein